MVMPRSDSSTGPTASSLDFHCPSTRPTCHTRRGWRKDFEEHDGIQQAHPVVVNRPSTASQPSVGICRQPCCRYVNALVAGEDLAASGISTQRQECPTGDLIVKRACACHGDDFAIEVLMLNGALVFHGGILRLGPTHAASVESHKPTVANQTIRRALVPRRGAPGPSAAGTDSPPRRPGWQSGNGDAAACPWRCPCRPQSR